MKTRIVRVVLVTLNIVFAVVLLNWAVGFGKWEEAVTSECLRALTDSGAVDLAVLREYTTSPKWDGPRNVWQTLGARADLMAELWGRVFVPLALFMVFNAIIMAAFWRVPKGVQ